MGRPINPAFTARNVELIARYRGDSSETLQGLSDDSGLSKSRLRRILEEATPPVVIRPEPKRTRVDNRYRNNHLVAIGARLQLKQIELKLGNAEMAVRLGLSEPHFGEAVQGLYNWKFSELARCSQVLGYTLESFLSLPESLKTCPAA